jgi:glutathione synthase/RimK-type ligase-like ATP-grasp enzyme
MIVLWGVRGDGPLDAVHACLERLGADFWFLDQRESANSSAVLAIEGRQLLLRIEGPRETGIIDFEHVCAAYLRPTETERALPLNLTGDGIAKARAESVDRAMITWADLATEMVVNPPAAMAANNSKPFQTRLISGYGFAVPETLVTTDPSAVREFAARHDRLIYKSVSGVRSIVNVLTDDGLERIADVANVPTQFQAYVPGFDVRVHVVGDKIFATEVQSSAYDYRYASLSGERVALAPIDLPGDVAQRCITMAAGMGLTVAGIDLRRTPDGTWVCFEVNPSPAFVYYEEATGQPIGNAIARLLVHADNQGRGGRRQGSTPGSQGGGEGRSNPTTSSGRGSSGRRSRAKTQRNHSL